MKQNGVVCWPGPALLLFIFRFEYLISGPLSYRDFRETGPRGLQTQRLFCMMQHFPQSSGAVDLSQVSKMLRQLTGQISAHYSSSKIKKTYLRLFRLDQGPHTVV